MLIPVVANGLVRVSSATAGLFVRGGAATAWAAATPPAWVTLCSTAAPLATMLIYFAPYPTLNQVAKENDVGSLPLLPYSSMVANCFLWTVYGFLKNSPKIIATNGIGVLFGLVYFLRFVQFAPPKAPSFPGSIRQHLLGVVTVLVASVGIASLVPLPEATAIIGNLSVLFSITMFGSPLSTLKTVIQTKSAKSIALPFTIATVLNCFFWLITGWFQMGDIKVALPNVLGLSSGLTQAAFKVLYGNGTRRAMKPELEEPLL